jgi:hypothetical protein
MSAQDDFWFAVNTTQVVLSPRKVLETFGTTCIRYHVVSELMDKADTIRVRAGRVYSERPQIIAPSHYANQLLDGFGEHAREYAEWLRAHGQLVKILGYGLQFRRDQTSQELIHEPIDVVVARVRESVEAENEAMTAVIIGADEMWEVSLLKFVFDYIQESAPTNMHELTMRASEEERREQAAIRADIEQEFRQATADRSRVSLLGTKLEKYGLFEEYEDRFYSLLR